MSLECKNCRAVYNGNISAFSKFVKCEYCGGVITIANTGKSEEMDFIEFNIELFSKFLRKRGITTFDAVSGILRIGAEEVTISEDGSMSGSKRLRRRVEGWLQKFRLQ